MSNSEKINILVVEDERPLLEAISTKLENEGFSVVTARTIDEALDNMNSETFDCVWLDHYLLSKKTGLDFVAKVKTEDKWKDLPIFVVTNTGGHEKKHTYLKLGATQYYIKADCRLDLIVKHIKEFLKTGKIN